MTPNQKERVLAAALGWLPVQTRAGDYVKFFGWSRRVLSESVPAAAGFFGMLSRFGHDAGDTMVVVDDDRRVPLDRMTSDDFTAALSQPNQFDSSLGGTHIATASGNLSVIVSWRRAPEQTQFLGTVNERWLDRPENVSTLKSALGELAVACGCEYVISAHVSDEVAKLRPGIPRYEAVPGAGIPFMAWLMVLGTDYVQAIGRARLDGLGAPTVSWSDGFATIVTSPSPLLYGSAEVRRAEERIRSVIGPEVFVDSRTRTRIGPSYPLDYVLGPRKAAEVWDAYPDGDQVRVVVTRRKDVSSE